jgi:catechol 2,3-dioxygenase-like lactoylglutathione lyase family enzyme
MHRTKVPTCRDGAAKESNLRKAEFGTCFGTWKEPPSDALHARPNSVASAHDMIFRIIPNLKVADAGAGHDFYVDFLGLEKQFDLGWVVSFRSPENPAIQVSLVSGDASAPEDSAMTVAVDDVDAAYEEAQRRGYEIVHPLTEEPWGPRRFFVRDLNGIVVNVLGHPD